MTMPPPRLLAISDLHVAFPENRLIVEDLGPANPHDWVLVAGDVAETYENVLWGLKQLASRFEKVIWSPGNHELWSHPTDPVTLRGVERYEALVADCRDMGVLTPEDEFAVWPDEHGDVIIAPLFLLYDYTFRVPGVTTKQESLADALEKGVLCADERFLHPDPYDGIDDWCRARIEYSRARLEACDPTLRTVLINHWPTVRDPTRILTYPEFAQWCGTELSADWHSRYRAAAVVYGHLHIPRVTWSDGVRMVETSLGYPREWTKQGHFSQSGIGADCDCTAAAPQAGAPSSGPVHIGTAQSRALMRQILPEPS